MSSTSSKTSAPQAPEPPETSATSEPPETPETPETIAVGRVLRPHGVRGEVVVEVLTDAPRRFDPGSS
ncbi:MAG: hypothetical protein JOZ15_07600, partial [Acidobacteria bacterium]|nr:hypothetical protein [Acidobacteriota bacterium]